MSPSNRDISTDGGSVLDSTSLRTLCRDRTRWTGDDRQASTSCISENDARAVFDSRCPLMYHDAGRDASLAPSCSDMYTRGRAVVARGISAFNIGGTRC